LRRPNAHVARWTGSESTSTTSVCSTSAASWSLSTAAPPGCRWPARPGGASRWASGARGDRVDERRAFRARHAGRAGLGRARRGCAQGQGLGALGVQDRPHRRARVLAELSWRDLVPAIWLPDPTIRRERELARFRLHLVCHRTTLKNRIHATLITFGHPCPVSHLFGLAGRELLDRLAIPDPWRRNVYASLELIDELELQIVQLTVELKRQAASPLRTAAGHRARVRLDQRLHRRLRDRRHRALRLAGQAVRLHRPVPTRHPVRRHRPARPISKARPALSALRRNALQIELRSYVALELREGKWAGQAAHNDPPCGPPSGGSPAQPGYWPSGRRRPSAGSPSPDCESPAASSRLLRRLIL
jgi:hypothetical protein